MHSTFQQPQQAFKHRQGSNGQHHGHKKQKTSGGGAINRYYKQPTMPTMQPYQPFGSWPNGLVNTQALTAYHYSTPAFPAHSMAVPFQQQAYEAMAQLSYHSVHPSYIEPPATPYSVFPVQSPGIGSGAWSAYSTEISTHTPSTDQYEVQQQSAAGEQAFFDFTAGNGPIHEDELPEDAEEYCEFTRGCPHVKDADVDKNLSIGLVLMKTARPANAALPATWEESNPDPSHPVKAIAYDPTRCTSLYHSDLQQEETMKPVRDSAGWEDVKQDPIFRKFPETTMSLTSGTTLRSAFTRRPDLPPDPPCRRVSAYSNPAPQPERLQKKRIFSQTDYDTGQENNKRARDARQQSDTYKRRSSSRERPRARSRERRQQRNVQHPIPAKPITAQSRIFHNGQLLPSSDIMTNSAGTVSQAVIPAAAAKQNMQVKLEEATQPDQIPQISEQADDNIATPSVPSAPAEADANSSNVAPLAGGVTTGATVDDRRESAWTKLARQYQAQAMQDMEIIDFD